MAARKTRPSLMGALLWIGLGILFLLRNFGLGPDIWSLTARYWPILLILLGLGKVIDYYRQKEGVSLRVGEVFGILFLLVIGSAVTGISNSGIGRVIRDIPIHIRGTEVRPGQWFGNSYSYTDEASYPILGEQSIQIENAYGLVSVAPGSDGEVRVRLRKVVYENDEPKAKQVAAQIRLEAGPDAQAEAAPPKAEAAPAGTQKSLVIHTNRDALSSGDYRFNTDLEVFVPKQSRLKITNSFGEVRVANLEGKIEASTSHHPIDVRDCSGEFTVSNRFAETRLLNLTGNVSVDARGRVFIEGVKGDVRVENEYSPVEIRDVTGKATVSNTESSITLVQISAPVVIEARGTSLNVSQLGSSLKATTSHRRVQISDVASDLQLESRYATVTLKDIKGNVDVASNSDRYNLEDVQGYLKVNAQATGVRVVGIRGPVQIQTTLKDVVVNDFAANCDVVTEYADVSLSIPELEKQQITVKNKNGAIQLFLPEDAAFQVNATARNGRVESDFAGLAPSEAAGADGRLTGSLKGGGPKIQLETEYSNIHLRTRDSNERRSEAGQGNRQRRSS
jgi:DUF4097 and DUF4098 domain-containing protein YvlB